MYPDESLFLGPEGAPPAGPLILGVPWPVPPGLVRTAAELAAGWRFTWSALSLTRQVI